MAVAAGRYEPGLATIYTPNRTTTDAGEPTVAIGNPVLYCRRYIRFDTTNASSQFNAGKTISTSELKLFLRKDSMTRKINTSMHIVHNGIKYGILGSLHSSYKDEVGFRVQSDS